jgi:hypothetical protein
MQLTKTHKIIISAVVVLILLGIYITFDRKSTRETKNNLDTISTSTSTDSNANTSIQGDGGYTIEQVPTNVTKEIPKPIPDLNRVSMSASGAMVSPEAKLMAEEKIKALQINLKENPAYLGAWIDLGIYQKMAGDYDGAVISWKYASKLAPTDYISLGNLGNLYAYFLKDNAQAEIYYKQAISRNPTQSYLYAQLFEVYRDVFKDLDKARAIVTQGLSKIPNNPNLLQLQASLK